jgi:hypothetical protein
MNVTVNCVTYGFIKTRLTVSAAGDATANIDGREIKVGVNPDLMAAMEYVYAVATCRRRDVAYQLSSTHPIAMSSQQTESTAEFKVLRSRHGVHARRIWRRDGS